MRLCAIFVGILSCIETDAVPDHLNHKSLRVLASQLITVILVQWNMRVTAPCAREVRLIRYMHFSNQSDLDV